MLNIENFSLSIFVLFLLKIGINTNGDKPLTLRMLEDMNIGQLQVIVNDLHCQIESIFYLKVKVSLISFFLF